MVNLLVAATLALIAIRQSPLPTKSALKNMESRTTYSLPQVRASRNRGKRI